MALSHPSSLTASLAADVLIIGAGLAGLLTALKVAPARAVVLAKAPLGEGASSTWAQGGIAAAVGADDAPALHAADTETAAAGIATPEVVRLLTREGPAAIDELARLGVRFDRAVDGSYSLGREGAHSRRRVLHAGGDGTGREIMRALVAAVKAAPTVTVLAPADAEDLIVSKGRVIGAMARHQDKVRPVLASAVVLATGGLGQAYARTTNPLEARGDGLAMAARAGAVLADPEFVQFHPTAIDVGINPMPLATEALRGEGALLFNDRGQRFLRSVHPLAELAPRDVVARAIWRQIQGGRRVLLDATQCVGSAFPERFPTVWGYCRASGIDPREEGIPVAPAVHYHMGGVAVDTRGRTSVPGLWACGEVSATGVHGANRLASNSLLEAAVFAGRVADDVTVRAATVAVPATLPEAAPAPGDGDETLKRRVQRLLYEAVGLIRAEASLIEALLDLERFTSATPNLAAGSRNLLTVAKVITAAALLRRESRGGHFRADHPEPVDAFQGRTFTSQAETMATIHALGAHAAPARSTGA